MGKIVESMWWLNASKGYTKKEFEMAYKNSFSDVRASFLPAIIMKKGMSCEGYNNGILGSSY